MWSNCLLDLGTDFLIGNMVSKFRCPYSQVHPEQPIVRFVCAPVFLLAVLSQPLHFLFRCAHLLLIGLMPNTV